MVEIRKASSADIAAIAKLAHLLWPHHEAAELETELAPMLSAASAAVFLAYDENIDIGFAQCQLRHDYVEGTNSSPVGYLEGIYVIGSYRQTGIARSLLSACEKWSKDRNCTEFASDCELTNSDSLHFHLSVGFEEANRIICFTKRL